MILLPFTVRNYLFFLWKDNILGMNFKNVTYEKGIQGMLYCDKSQLKGVVIGTT